MKLKGLILLSISLIGLTAIYPSFASTYGKWEHLSWKHAREFEAEFSEEEGLRVTDLNNSRPEFMKVIRHLQ
jgi:hypothetical protein